MDSFRATDVSLSYYKYNTEKTYRDRLFHVFVNHLAPVAKNNLCDKFLKYLTGKHGFDSLLIVDCTKLYMKERKTNEHSFRR